MRGNLMGAAMGVVAAAAVLTACSSGGSASSADGSTSGAGSSSAAGPSSSAEAGSAQTVKVSATEFKLALASTSLAPGTYTFQMADDGHATHAIAIAGPGVDGKQSGTAGPGGTASLTVTLQKGTYTIWCPVGNHRALGMQTTVTVG